MATSKTSIVNLAAILLGHAPVTSLENADDLITSLSTMYDNALPAALCKTRWRFASQITQLSQSVEAPPTFWEYVYLLPADWLKTIRVYPHNYDFQIYQSRKLYTNTETDWYMEYVFQPDESLLPEYFVSYFKYELAAPVALTNAQKPEYANALEAKRVAELAIASAIDAQNSPNVGQQDFPVLSARNIDGFMRNFD
jgi:hypothetical protein